MPDGTSPLPPAQEQAQAIMRQWMEAHSRPSSDGGGFAALGGLSAAAGAGEFTIAPETANAIIDQLRIVQDSAIRMGRDFSQFTWEAPLGGGYAQQVSAFDRQLADSAQEKLTTFSAEIDTIIQAVAASMAHYRSADEGNADHFH
ncbi:hypothetical protein [Actinokineospora iranica]|uniref:PE family protein n=1 Tax=Actinokineospora iranica TaxID=1271860 RepID=A0A1G6SPL0_9PSEU|nr:hypothetical protein [Actinokineospora iranica]SDD18076.1 hypothetical protein SAMN05216174_10868 [Actinokineospora iranica]